MMRHWASYADGAYLGRLKALHASMLRHCGDFTLHVLAWDDAVAEWGHRQEDVLVTEAGEFLADHPELRPENLPGPVRTKVEHYWTVGPAFIADCIRTADAPVMYADADTFLFSSPEPIFDEICDAPAAVFPHSFALASRGLPGPTVESHICFGANNVGFVYIADARIAKAWADQCRTWCYDRLEVVPIPERQLRYGDQRYLDDWPARYGAHVVKHPGACLGPWAIHTRPLGQDADGHVQFGGRELIAYHFSGLRELPDGMSVNTRPEYALPDEANMIYAPYWRALYEAKGRP